MAASPRSLTKLVVIFALSLVVALNFNSAPTFALNIGLKLVPGFNVSKECSRTCESKFCGLAPFLRYGKYCGLLYSGCPREAPCDGLDSCCMNHDQCIQAKNDYLNESCNKRFLSCINNFQRRKGKAFKGNTCSVDDVISVIKKAIEAAIIAGKIFHKP